MHPHTTQLFAPVIPTPAAVPGVVPVEQPCAVVLHVPTQSPVPCGVGHPGPPGVVSVQLHVLLAWWHMCVRAVLQRALLRGWLPAACCQAAVCVNGCVLMYILDVGGLG